MFSDKMWNNMKFVDACKYGDLDQVKDYYLLNHNVDIHYEDDQAFLFACENGHIEIVKYLLTSPDLKEHINIHTQNDLGFIYACDNNNLEMVKYLLTSPELKEHANIHAQNDKGFNIACLYKDMEILNYLIFEYKIEKTESIIKIAKDYKYDYLFKQRELEEELNKNVVDKEQQKPFKI